MRTIRSWRGGGGGGDMIFPENKIVIGAIISFVSSIKDFLYRGKHTGKCAALAEFKNMQCFQKTIVIGAILCI